MNPKPTVLLVDDDPAILMTVGDRLAAEGYDVIKATSGQEGLHQLERHRADMIVLDIGMPQMSGLAFLKQASQNPGYKDIPILVFTARSNMQDFFSGMGVSGFIPKTAEPELLVKTVRSIITEQKSRLSRLSAQAASPAILILEDDEHLQRHLTRLLRAHNTTPHPIGNPDELSRAISAYSPRTILLKYLLPKVSGPTLARMLHDAPLTRDIPVILYDDSGLHRNAPIPTPNVTHFLCSPTDEDFLRSVTHALGMN